MLAGVCGFFAALTRVEGVLLVVPFLIEWGVALYESRGDWFKWPLDTVVKPLIGWRSIPLGLASYMALSVGAARRPALLLARAGALGPLPRAAVGELRSTRISIDHRRTTRRRRSRTSCSR